MEQPRTEPTADETKTFRVEVSFYVEASSEREARSVVARELNSAPVQRLIGESVGDADVHEDAEEWDMGG